MHTVFRGVRMMIFRPNNPFKMCLMPVPLPSFTTAACPIQYEAFKCLACDRLKGHQWLKSQRLRHQNIKSLPSAGSDVKVWKWPRGRSRKCSVRAKKHTYSFMSNHKATMLPLPLFVMASEIGQDTLCPSTDEVRLLFVQKSEYHTSPTIHQSKLFYSKLLLFGVVIVEVPHCRRYHIVGRSEKGCIRRRPLLSLKHLYWMGRPFLHIYCRLWYAQCVHICGTLSAHLCYT